MIAIICSACRKKLSVKDNLAGKKVKCPGCGATMLVPASVAAHSSVNEEMGTLPAAPATNPSLQDARTVPPADADSKLTNPSLSNPDQTLAANARGAGHDASLTDFLAPPQADDELGRLGKYRILKILGHGGMGVVYKAQDPRLKRTVAIKAMLPTLAASASAGKRFLREAEAMAALKHDHIVSIYDVDEERGVPFMAMEFLKGEPLDERLKRDEELPLAEMLRIGREIAQGLAAAHHTGLIHRDIKPANIWLEDQHNTLSPGGRGQGEGGEGRVKILDFGLARAATQDAGLTQQGSIIGTPAYMAPEQGRGDDVDARCDLFSLGVVLYRMCTGQQPFVGRDTVSTLMAVALHEPTAPRKLNEKLPKELAELIMGLLEKDPAKRIASADEVVKALQKMERELIRKQEATEVTVKQSITPATLPSPGTRGKGPGVRASRRKLPLILAGVALLALFVGTWAVFFRQTNNGIVPVPKVPGQTPAPNYALSFDGTSSHVKIASLGSVDSGPRTIEAYVIPATLDVGTQKNKDGIAAGAGAIVTQSSDARSMNLGTRKKITIPTSAFDRRSRGTICPTWHRGSRVAR